jgi:hypothetical protein
MTHPLTAVRPANAVESAESLLWHVSFAERPMLACSRACSKVAALARTPGRDALHYIVSALNEQMHGLSFECSADRTMDQQSERAWRNQASEHFAARDHYMAQFKRAIERAA